MSSTHRLEGTWSNALISPNGPISYVIENGILTSVSRTLLFRHSSGIEPETRTFQDIYDPITGLPVGIAITGQDGSTQMHPWTSSQGSAILITKPQPQPPVASITTTDDLDGTAPWTSRVAGRDEDGNLLWIERLGDDGINRKSWYYRDDYRAHTFSVDANDTKPWLISSVARYDNGDESDLSSIRFTLYDDFTYFQVVNDPSGDYFARVFLDLTDSHAWTAKLQVTGADGRSQQLIRWDDGREVSTDLRVDGTREQMVVEDLDNAFAFHRSTIDYDTSGTIARRVIEMDDGREITEGYDTTGLLRTRITDDVDDAYAWDSISRVYDADGDLLTQVVTPDAGDAAL